MTRCYIPDALFHELDMQLEVLLQNSHQHCGTIYIQLGSIYCIWMVSLFDLHPIAIKWNSPNQKRLTAQIECRQWSLAFDVQIIFVDLQADLPCWH